MKKVIAFIKDLPRQWRAETPRIAKWIRNIAGVLTVSIPPAYAIVNNMGSEIPHFMSVGVTVITFVCSLIVTIAAGTKEKKG
jgi:hypothetical protein